MKRISLFLLAILFAVVASAQAKYIFYLIGDGMGPNEVLLAEMYQAELDGKIGRKQLCMTQFPYSGQASTYSASNGITDSSAAGTCLASGKKTNNGMLGQTPDGKPAVSIAETLHKKGWAVGVTTSVSIDHATPGAFYAHVAKRSDYYHIGQQLANTCYDFFGGATFYYPTEKGNAKSPNLYTLCEQKGYTFVHGYGEYAQASKNDKLILIQANEGKDITAKGGGMIPYALDRNDADLTLPQITSCAVDFLSKKNKPFFLMVEGGAIDWACHGNDGASVIGEVLEFDKAVEVAFNFYRQHPSETLIVVTADHETGGLSLGNSHYELDLKLLQYQKGSAGVISEKMRKMMKKQGKDLAWDDVKAFLTENLGLYEKVKVSDEEDAALRATFAAMMNNEVKDEKTLYESLNGLSNQAIKLLNKKAQLGWTTGSHSAAAVPVFAIGVGAETFSGWHDNSELMPLLLKASGN